VSKVVEQMQIIKGRWFKASYKNLPKNAYFFDQTNFAKADFFAYVFQI